LGIGDWAQSPIPNPQSPIPNPHKYFLYFTRYIYIIILKIYFNVIIGKLNKKWKIKKIMMK
jgi:hypothetical protein